MFELLKKFMDNLVNLVSKLKCHFSCCSSNVNVKVFERKKTPL